mgnify:CR=1 FL=1
MTPSEGLFEREQGTTAGNAAILVVDDEALFGKAVVRRLRRAGYDSEHALTLNDATELVAAKDFALLLLDMRLPDGSGLDFLKQLRTHSSIPVIVMPADGEVDDAGVAMKHAASDYLKKPLDLDELVFNVDKVISADAVSERLEYSQAREHQQAGQAQFLGQSAIFRQVRGQVMKIAALVGDGGIPPTVLITGETGSGKDVTARLLHQASPRCERPFVHVDCAALPKDLIEAELFGHVRGAFTDAVSERTGLIEAAEDGVVFLDEIGEIPLELQAKLLAVLERRSLRRLGSSQERQTQAWFIAATNRPVDEMVAAGTLRSDLYFRLNVLSLALPSLRERGDDSVLLARHFAADVAGRYGLAAVTLSAAAEQAIRTYHWPGNVRELSHVIERAVLLCSDGHIGETELALPGDTVAASTQDSTLLDGLTLEAVEKLMIERALAACDGNVSQAARRLGITRMTMRYRLQKYAEQND